MLEKSDLQAISELMDVKLEKVKQEMSELMDTKLETVKREMSELMDFKLGPVKRDIEVLKRSALITETEIAPAVRVLLENHTELAKNINVAKDVEERVGMLEFQVKVIREVLDTMRKAA